MCIISIASSWAQGSLSDRQRHIQTCSVNSIIHPKNIMHMASITVELIEFSSIQIVVA